jgi:hypothetical protein
MRYLGMIVALIFLSASVATGHAYTVGKSNMAPFQSVSFWSYCTAVDQSAQPKTPPDLMEYILELALDHQDAEVLEIISKPASPCKDVRVTGLSVPIEGVTSIPYKKLIGASRCFDIWLTSTADYGWIYTWYVCSDRTNSI